MENFEKVLLKQNVKTIPKKMMIPKILMVTALILAFAFPIIVQVVESFKVMFMS